MSYTQLLVLWLAGAGCASAGSSPDGIDGGVTDGSPTDATGVDGLVDAPGGCTMMMRNLLVNESFDLTPIGTGWTAQPIDPTYPIITADGTLVHSAPNKAWMGGFAQANATDALYQNVSVPATTTSLVLTGFYEIRTGELFNVPYDLAKVELTTPTNTVLQQVLAVDNRNKTTAWTPLDHTFASSYAGQTVRLRMTTSNDSADATSFYFDSLALTATYCE